MDKRRHWRTLELGGGSVEYNDQEAHDSVELQSVSARLLLPTGENGYADAQIDDYGGRRRRSYLWRPGTMLSMAARFSHDRDALVGTAGFGFWNAPFGDPTVPYPALPQATWFFFGSKPNDLPLAPRGPGRGWFASTLDATTWRAKRWAPLAPIVVLGNRWTAFHRLVWPRVQSDLGISFAALDAIDLRAWHQYQLNWGATGCEFRVDGRLILRTSQSPRGPLGFVCWIDNQYMVATATGRFAAGWLPIKEAQWLEVADLRIQRNF